MLMRAGTFSLGGGAQFVDKASREVELLAKSACTFVLTGTRRKQDYVGMPYLCLHLPCG
jgi:hypothetical protein